MTMLKKYLTHLNEDTLHEFFGGKDKFKIKDLKRIIAEVIKEKSPAFDEKMNKCKSQKNMDNGFVYVCSHEITAQYKVVVLAELKRRFPQYCESRRDENEKRRCSEKAQIIFAEYEKTIKEAREKAAKVRQNIKNK